MNDWNQIIVKNPNDRRELAGILLANGYEVRERRVRLDPAKSTRVTVVEYRRVEE